ncbi:MAG: hypothetical protein CL927_05890 [Deltaproteobacteria bacterium]|nr:hypothetical protein [Deltaproteobacteria bacterium]HCH66170.1 hypothetical protein [Deltaproteobacteria bacterium]
MLWDIGLSVEAYAVNRQPASTLEDQRGYDVLIGGVRTVGIGSALVSARHLAALDQDVNQIPVLASAASSFGGLLFAVESGDAKREPPQQGALTALRVASGGLVATQAVFNRLAIRPLCSTRPMAFPLQLSVGASHVALVGSF